MAFRTKEHVSFMGLDSKFSGALFYRLGQYFQLSPKWLVLTGVYPRM